MRFIGLNGREHNASVTRYQIEWTGGREVSKPQAAVKHFVYPYWKNHLVLEEFRIPGTKMRVDLLNLTRRIAIEISPSQHFEYNPFFHRGSKLNFVNARRRDMDKQLWFEKNGIQYAEITDAHLKKLSVKLFRDEFNIDL